MNEVTVLSAAGELTGRAVGTGLLLARRVVVATGQAATGLVVAAGRAGSRATADTVRAHHRLAERTRAVSLPEVRVPPVRVPDVRELRRELATAVAPTRRRRWPWVVLALGVLTGVAYRVAARRPVASPPAPTPPRVRDVGQAAVDDLEAVEVVDPELDD